MMNLVHSIEVKLLAKARTVQKRLVIELCTNQGNVIIIGPWITIKLEDIVIYNIIETNT